MSIIDDNIVVKYQTYKEYCSCCSREFEKKELSEIKEFNIIIKKIFEWAGWSTKDDIYEEEISLTIEEYLYNTISFYALDGNDELHLSEDEIKKIEALVKEVIKTM